MKKILIYIIITALLLYFAVSVYETLNKPCGCEQEEVVMEVEENNSEYVDYAKVEATQRRRGLMKIR